MIDQKRYGIILGYLIVVAEGVSGLLFTPILLNALGQDEYGLYKLALSWMSIISTLDFGLGGTITRYVVKYRVLNDKEGEQKFLGIAYRIYAALSFMVMILGICLSLVLPNISASILPENVAKFRLILWVLTVKTAILLFNHAYSGRFVAYEEFIYIKSVSLVSIIIRLIAVVVILNYIQSVMVVVFIDLAIALFSLISHIFFSKSKQMVPIGKFQWDANMFKEILGFTVSIFVISIINQFNGNVDNVILGIYSTTYYIGLYSSIMQIYTIYCSLSTSIQDVFAPEVSKSVFLNKSDDEVTKSIIAPSRMQAIILMLALEGFLLFGREFLKIWLGTNYQGSDLTAAYLCGLLVMLAGFWHLAQNSATNILKAKNKLSGRVILIACSTAVNFIITMMLVPIYGMIGAAIGTAFSLVFGFGLATNIYYSRAIHLNLKLFYKGVFSKLWLAFIVSLFIGFAVKTIPLDGLTGLVIKGILYIVFYVVSVFIIGFNKDEKNRMIKMFKFY